MRPVLLLLAAAALATACQRERPALVAATPLARAGDGGFVRPELGDAGLARVVVDPMDPESLYRAGQESFLAGEFEPSIELFKKALRLKPSAKAWHALGDALMTAGRFNEAADAFEEAVTLEPGKRLSWMRLGRCLSSAGRPGEAAEAFHKAFELKADADALRQEADALVEAHREDEAVGRLQQALALEPAGAARDWKLVGQIRARQEKWPEAVAALKESAKLHPDPGILSELGEALVHEKDLEGALAAFEEAARLDPADPLAPETAAEIRLAKGDLAGARAAFALSLKAKDRPVPHLSLGRLALKEGKKDEAKAELDKAMGALQGDEAAEMREVARFASEVGVHAVADKLLLLLAEGDEGKSDPGLFLELARVRRAAGNAKGVAEACARFKAAAPAGDKTVCPPK